MPAGLHLPVLRQIRQGRRRPAVPHDHRQPLPGQGLRHRPAEALLIPVQQPGQMRQLKRLQQRHLPAEVHFRPPRCLHIGLHRPALRHAPHVEHVVSRVGIAQHLRQAEAAKGQLKGIGSLPPLGRMRHAHSSHRQAVTCRSTVTVSAGCAASSSFSVGVRSWFSGVIHTKSRHSSGDTG